MSARSGRIAFLRRFLWSGCLRNPLSHVRRAVSGHHSRRKEWGRRRRARSPALASRRIGRWRLLCWRTALLARGLCLFCHPRQRMRRRSALGGWMMLGVQLMSGRRRYHQSPPGRGELVRLLGLFLQQGLRKLRIQRHGQGHVRHRRDLRGGADRGHETLQRPQLRQRRRSERGGGGRAVAQLLGSDLGRFRRGGRRAAAAVVVDLWPRLGRRSRNGGGGGPDGGECRRRRFLGRFDCVRDALPVSLGLFVRLSTSAYRRPPRPDLRVEGRSAAQGGRHGDLGHGVAVVAVGKGGLAVGPGRSSSSDRGLHG